MRKVGEIHAQVVEVESYLFVESISDLALLNELLRLIKFLIIVNLFLVLFVYFYSKLGEEIGVYRRARYHYKAVDEPFSVR